jgi:hypothetical protein
MKKLLLSLVGTLLMAVGCLATATTGGTPVINSFDASPGSITSGESSTLSWSVSDATAVSMDQGIGNVALSGTRVVSPSATTTYTLTATNDAGSATATAQVMIGSTSEAESDTESEAEPETVSEHTVTLYSIAAEDGNVRQGGGGPDLDITMVGDDISNKPRQAFLSFDISGIPVGATIKSASLDISNGTKTGKPFAELGVLRVYNDQYGHLGPVDFTSGFPGGHMKSYSLSTPPTAPFSNTALIAKIQTRANAGDSRFQVRLQFEKQTNHNGKRDALKAINPKLVITYEE